MALPPLLRTRRYAQRDVPYGPRGGVLACDSFDGRTAIGSTDGIPHRSGAGKAWTQQSGTIVCASGSLKASSAGIGTIDPGVADAFRVRFQISGATSANNNRFAVRLTDVNNYVGLVITSTAISWVTIIAGTPAAIGSGGGSTSPTVGDVVEISVNGNALSGSLFRAGALVGTAATATNSTGAGVTPLGVRFADTTFAMRRSSRETAIRF